MRHAGKSLDLFSLNSQELVKKNNHLIIYKNTIQHLNSKAGNASFLEKLGVLLNAQHLSSSYECAKNQETLSVIIIEELHNIPVQQQR